MCSFLVANMNYMQIKHYCKYASLMFLASLKPVKNLKAFFTEKVPIRYYYFVNIYIIFIEIGLLYW